MNKNSISIKDSLNVNTNNNRYIVKLFGEMNHDHISIEKDQILTISKIKIDNFEKKGQISKWQFNLDQIYSYDTTFEELFENEIDNTDFFNEFSTKVTHRSIIFVGDRNDSLTEDPYRTFISKCIKNCISDINTNNFNKDKNEFLIPITSFCEINKSYLIDYLKNITDMKNYEGINDTKNNSNIISNPKISIYEDDIIIDELNQVQFSNEKEFSSLLNLSKKNLDYYKFNKCNLSPDDESLTQILTLKLIKSKTNECYSKINFVLYKAYEILDEDDEDESENIILPPEELKKSQNFKKKKIKKNNLYNLYTKDNYSFFRGIQNKINYRVNYILKYIKDTIDKGTNLFIVLLPCEYQYLLLIHDLLDNINMRKLIVENIYVDEDDTTCNDLGEFYQYDNDDEGNSFQSFSKNNSVITNRSSILTNEGNKFLYNSAITNDTTQKKNKRMELNLERISKISNKKNIIKLFDIFDEFGLNFS